jgi:NADH-quinone oxidoreductase subunit L
VVGLAGIRGAYAWYVLNPSWPAYWAEKYKGAYTLLLSKYKVDEVYNYIFVDGLVHKLAKVLYTIGDVKIIDGAVNGLAQAISSTSQQSRKIQTGYVQQYAFTMGLGLVVLVGLYYVLN